MMNRFHDLPPPRTSQIRRIILQVTYRASTECVWSASAHHCVPCILNYTNEALSENLAYKQFGSRYSSCNISLNTRRCIFDSLRPSYVLCLVDRDIGVRIFSPNRNKVIQYRGDCSGMLLLIYKESCYILLTSTFSLRK